MISKARASCSSIFARGRAREGNRQGYRPTVYLGMGFYVQAAFSYDFRTAVRSFSTLVALRSVCGEVRGEPSRVSSSAVASETNEVDGGGSFLSASQLFERRVRAVLMVNEQSRLCQLRLLVRGHRA